MKTSANNHYFKKIIGLLLGLYFLILTGISLVGFDEDGLLLISDDFAFADESAEDAPIISSNIILYKNGMEYENLGKIIIDISSKSWYSKSVADVEASIFGALGVKYTIGEYSYIMSRRFWVNGVGSSVAQSTSTKDIQVFESYSNISLMDSSITVTQINVNGTRWDGTSVSNYNILANPQSTLAGNYVIQSITYVYNFEVDYIASGTVDVINCTSDGGGTALDAEYLYSTINLSNATVTEDLTEQNIGLFLKTKVSVGGELSGLLENNLGIKAVYDSQTRWADNIFLYKKGVVENPQGSTEFYYSLDNGTRNMFTTTYGFSSSIVNSSFGLDDNLDDGNCIASYLKLVWYYDSLITTALISDETINSGKYYLHIEGNNADGFMYYNEMVDKKNYAVEFTFSKSGQTAEYIQSFIVEKACLELNLDEGIGIKLNADSSGVASTPFNSKFTLASLFYQDNGVKIPAGEYYEKNTSDEYVATTDTNFALLKKYYLNKCSIGNVILNSIDSSSNASLWTNLGGYEKDFNNYISGENNVLFVFNGSYFPGNEIKSYEYIDLTIAIGITEIAKNYTFVLGKVVGDSFVGYDSSGETNKLLQEGENSLNDSTQKKYRYYNNFAVIAPEITVDLSEFSFNVSSSTYGTIWKNSDIDYSSVKITGSSQFSNGYYDIQTASSNWRLKIVKSNSEMVADGNYNYIFVYMQLAKASLLNIKNIDDYQDKDGNLYSPYGGILYAGDYYFVFTVSYLLQNTSNVVSLGGCTNGKISVNADVGNGLVGITTLCMPQPASYSIQKTQLYLHLTDYYPDKYYDGTANVKDKQDSENNAIAVLEQREGFNLSPVLQGMNFSTIIEYDLKENITYSYNILYSSYMASDNDLDIYGDVSINPKGGINKDVFDLIIQSYEIDTILYHTQNGSLTSDGLCGKILRRTLEFNILKNPDRITDISNVNYSKMEYNRSYNTDAYVAIRVAKYSDTNFEGTTLENLYKQDSSNAPIVTGKEYYADYYYFYDQNEHFGSYYFYSELPGIFTGTCYILLEIIGESDKKYYGFLNNDTFKDGFDWDTTNSEITKFNLNPYSGVELDVKTYDFLDWAKSLKENLISGDWEEILINKNTSSGFFKIPVAQGIQILNYNICLSATSPIYPSVSFEITKIVKQPEEVFDFQLEDSDKGRILIYDKTKKIDTIYTSDLVKSFILISRHNEYDKIREDAKYLQSDGSSNFESLIRVIGFSVGGETEEFDDDKEYAVEDFTSDITNMLLAGDYVIEVIAPETENYKEVKGQTTLRVYRAQVTVYATSAIRTYMSEYDVANEVSADTSLNRKKILTSSELEDYVAYMDSNSYELFPEDKGGYIKSYVYYKNDDIASQIYDTSKIRLYYVGFAENDYFSDGTDREATVSVDKSIFMIDGSYIDQAGRKTGVITISGAFKANYKFNYISGDLFVKKQSLVLSIEENQKLSYDGTNLSPLCDVITEDGQNAPGDLSQFVAAYYAKNSEGIFNIYVRDFGDINNTFIKQASMSIGPDELDKRDYYFYFEKYVDESNNEFDVKHKGAELYFIDGEKRIKVYPTGSKYYYYKNNDNTTNRVILTKTEIGVYLDGDKHYYYKNNDTSNVKTYLSRNVNPNFDLVDEGYRTAYVDVVDGLNMYIGVNESENASIYDRTIKNVFYDDDNNKGGYILKVYAAPSSASGGSSTNYARTKTKVVFMNVEVLDIYLSDENSKDYNGTILNPVWTDKYLDKEYALKEFGDYYKGLTLSKKSVNLNGNWANVEIDVKNGAQMFEYMYSEDADFADNSLMFFADYENGKYGDFHTAVADDKIVNTGLYIVLVKVTLNNAVNSEDGELINMRRNLRFSNRETQANFCGEKQIPTEDYQAYFVLYLTIERSDDIVINVNASENIASTHDSGEGYLNTFTKVYDATELWFKSTMQVLGVDSSNGEILNIRAYMSTLSDYTKKESEGNYSFEYFRSVDGAIQNKWVENKYISLTHVQNEFYITFIANFNDKTESAIEGTDSTFDNNFVTMKQVYRVIIEKKNLIVKIRSCNPDTEEEAPADEPDKYSYKYYGQKNSQVENNFYFIYEGFVNSIDENNLLELITVEPIIDWTKSVATDVVGDPEGQKTNSGLYFIQATGGVEPLNSKEIDGETVYYSDYEFDYNDTLDFEIRKLQLVLGGDSFPRIEISTSKSYEGSELEPDIIRYGWDGQDLSKTGSDISYNPKSKTYLGRIENYSLDKTDYTEEDVVWEATKAVHVGYYLFRIEVGSSKNYIGLSEPILWVFEITKSELVLQFVGENGEVGRGSASTTYDGTTGRYPSFDIKYSGFIGDDNIDNYKGIQKIKFKPASIPDGYYNGIDMLGLVNPLYVFVDSLTGNETHELPQNAGTYYIKIVIDEESSEESPECYGYADNYKIIVQYEEKDGQILYPVFTITKRKVGVNYVAGKNLKIEKEYDGTDVVHDNSVAPPKDSFSGHYTFSPMSADTGLIVGDVIGLKINYNSSKYQRITVYDIYDVMSDIDVYLHVDASLIGEDADNYEFSMSMSDTYTINGVTYVKLCGVITPARANVKFMNNQGQIVNVLRTIYDGEPQPAILSVEGVNGEVLTKANGDYTVWYTSEKTNWNSDIAPTNCDYYEVVVTITNKNYSESPQTGYVEILQAEVEINFGGEGIQMYGNVIDGLTAIANGVHGYGTSLFVVYYYINEDGSIGEIVPDISVAQADTYIAEAIHYETDNFAYKRATEIFTISKRETLINYDVASRYLYNGKPVSIKMYFVDNGEIYYPQCIFDRLQADGSWIPVNYQVNENGEIVNIRINPIDAGIYRVKAYELYENYFITNPVWCSFEIEKAELTIQVEDSTIKQDDEYTIHSTMINCLTHDSIDSVLSGLNYNYYNAVTGEEITNKPTQPGTYRVVGYGALSNNYNLNYKFGILTINKTLINASSSAQGDDNSDRINVIFEGSFSADMLINVVKKQNIKYSDMHEAYESYKNNTDNGNLNNYKLKDVYVFEYINYVSTNTGMNTVVKLYMPELFKKDADQSENSLNIKLADNERYYVAVLSADGELSVEEAYRDGDYLCFNSQVNVIKAVSVLTTAEEINNQFDWLLYVGIAVAVALIALAIIIVVKKS